MVSIAKAPLRGLQATAECAVKIKESTDTLDKFSKVISSSFRAAQGFGVSSQPLAKMVGQFETFSGLVGGFNIINRIADWSCKGKNGDYAWKFWKKKVDDHTFCDDGYKSGAKVGNEALLTVVHGIDFTRFLGGVGAFDLGPAAAPLSLAKSIILLPVAALGIWDAAAKISNANRYVRNVANRVNKWATRAGLGKVDLKNLYDEKKAAAAAKIVALKDKIVDASENVRRRLGAEIEKLELKERRWSCYLKEIDALAEGEDTLPEGSQFRNDCEVKHKGWEKNYKVAKTNATREKTKSWLEIVGSIGKIALGVIGIVALFVGFMFNPAFIIATALAWTAIYTLGLTKNLYGMYNPIRQIEKPKLAPPPEIVDDEEVDGVDEVDEGADDHLHVEPEDGEVG